MRDRLMDRCPKDKDYVICNVNEASFVSKFPEAVKAGASFPVFILSIEGDQCDIAMARTEKKIGIGYRGFEVKYGPEVTIEEDLFRRDTTINSMAWSLPEGALIDPYGGQSDIKAGIIRATSDHFCEDPVRALRAARQAAEFGFSIEGHTLDMMGCCSSELLCEPRERIFGELERAMLCIRPSVFFSMLAEAGILGAVIPPLDEMWKMQSEEVVKDFKRMMSMLDKTAELSQRPEVRFASLVRSVALSSESCKNLVYEIDRALRLPKIWQRCAEFASVHLPGPAKGKDPAAAVDTLTKLQNHPIGIDGCVAIAKAEGTIDSYHFLAKSKLYLEAMKKASSELPPGIEGKARGEWIRARQIEEIGRICGV